MTIFLSYYKVGDAYVYDDSEYIFGERTDPALKNGYGKIGLTWIEMNTKEVLKGKEYDDEYGWLFSYNQLLEELENYKQKKEEWNKKGFIQIGHMQHWDIILLGIESHNVEEIWVFGHTLLDCVGKKYARFSKNIFDFISLLEQFWVAEDLEEAGLDSSRVYKNWGEDFWRVREDNEVG